MSRRFSLFIAAAAAGLAYGCESYDPPEQAEPFDTIAPAPAPVVPGADEPGAQDEP